MINSFSFENKILVNTRNWLLNIFYLCIFVIPNFTYVRWRKRNIKVYLFTFLKLFFFLSITTKYIQQLITMLLKIKLTKKDNAGHLLLLLLLFFNKQNKTKKHTHIYTHKKRQKKKTRWNYSLPAPSLFILNGVSISHMINGMPFL